MIYKIVKWLSIFLILFIGGCFLGFPVIPWIETHYYETKSNRDLNEIFILKSPIQLNIQDVYSEGSQCIDVIFTRADANTDLKILDFDIEILNPRNRSVSINEIYLFENEDTRQLKSLNLIKTDTSNHRKYRMIRTVFNLRGSSKFNIHVKSIYEYQGKSDSLDMNVSVVKNYKLIFDRLRFH